MAAMPAANRPAAISILQASHLQNLLGSSDLHRISDLGQVAHARRGEEIWPRERRAYFHGVSYRGFVKVMDRRDPKVHLGLCGPGGCFVARADVRIVALTEFWYLAVPDSCLTDADADLWERAAQAHTPELLVRMAHGRVQQRIAAVLLLLARSYGQRVSRAWKLLLPLTRRELGELAGTTVETTIRVMSQWQRQGVLSTDRQFITILDEAVLRQLVLGSS